MFEMLFDLQHFKGLDNDINYSEFKCFQKYLQFTNHQSNLSQQY